MKPIENVSIGGCVFSLEDDAAQIARSYISELEGFYSGQQSGAEVMEGIEERMSELLIERCGHGGVVTRPMVESVISILGKPEAIEEEAGEDTQVSGEGAGNSAPKDGNKIRKRLYRDPSTGMVAGVCSGLGTYSGVDPTLYRIIFTVLTLAGCGFFYKGYGGFRLPELLVPMIYLVLWICMPVARTVFQRDEMRGEKGTVDAISARVREAAGEAGEAAGRVARSDFWPVLWRIFGICLGVIFLMTGVAGVVSLGCLAVDGDLLTHTFFMNRLLEEIASDAPRVLDMLSYPPLVAALAVSVVMPFIALIYGGILLLFNLKSPSWHPGLWMLVIWLVALTVLAVLSAVILAKGIV